MLRLAMTPLPLLLLVYQCSPCIALHFLSSITDGTPMQLLRGFPWCHLNSALPPLFSIRLSACVPKHFCLMTSFFVVFTVQAADWPPSFSTSQLLCRNVDCAVYCVIMAWGTGSPAASSLSSRVNSHFSLLLTEKGTAWPQRTHGKDKQLFGFDNQCQRDLSLTVSVCICKWVCVCESLWMLLSEVSRETTGAEWPNTRYTLFLSRPGQGKTC